MSLQRADQVMAAPIYLPADPDIGAEAVPVAAERRTSFVRNTDLLLREQHPGPAWAAVAVWTGFVVMMAVWVSLMAVTALRVRTGPQAAGDRPGGLGATTDWTVAPAARSMAPHAR